MKNLSKDKDMDFALFALKEFVNWLVLGTYINKVFEILWPID